MAKFKNRQTTADILTKFNVSNSYQDSLLQNDDKQEKAKNANVVLDQKL